MLKKNIAKLLVFAMLLAMLPFTVAADTATTTPETKTGDEVTDASGYITGIDVYVSTANQSKKTPSKSGSDTDYSVTCDVKYNDTAPTSLTIACETVANTSVTAYQNATKPDNDSSVSGQQITLTNNAGTITFNSLTTTASPIIFWLKAVANGDTHWYKVTVNVAKEGGTTEDPETPGGSTNPGGNTGGSEENVVYTIAFDTNNKTSVKVDEKITLKATVSYTGGTVSNPEIKWSTTSDKVTVNANTGEVTGKAKGNATIKAEYTPAKGTCAPATCTVTVEPAQSSSSGSGGGGDSSATADEVIPVELETVTTEKVEIEEGKEVPTAVVGTSAEDVKAVTDAFEDAKTALTTPSEGTSEPVKTVDVVFNLSDKKVDGAEVKAAQLPLSVFETAKAYNREYANQTDTEIRVAVKLPKSTVILTSAGISGIPDSTAAGENLLIACDDITNNPPAAQKPSGNIKAAYDVNIKVGTEDVKWSGTTIKLYVAVEDTGVLPTNLNRVKVYLDKTGTNLNPLRNKGEIHIPIPHLTLVSLVEETSTGGGSTGGGGGGSPSKPSVKPGETQKPNAPTTSGGGVAGFNDVAPSAWYADAVKYVVDKGLFGGVGNGNFAPDANMTRAMMWTVLARYMGVNTNTGSNWYEAAREWAIAQGISDGTMADGNVTREQFVTMLWRLCGEPKVESSASFTDGGSVSGYAKAAVDWAVSQGIVNGYNDGSFKPQGSATRAEVAKMLTVFCTNAENAPAETTPTETVPDEEK